MKSLHDSQQQITSPHITLSGLAGGKAGLAPRHCSAVRFTARHRNAQQLSGLAGGKAGLASAHHTAGPCGASHDNSVHYITVSGLASDKAD